MKPLPSGTPCAIRSGVRHCGNGSERASRSSTPVTADADGDLLTEVRFTAFGEIRYESGDTTTDKFYTGQRQEYEIGLDYYVARWYDPEIAHFTQPDTIIADPYNPMAWNRYAYVNYNPINYMDPSGHMVDEEGSYNPWRKTVTTDVGVYDVDDNIWISHNINFSDEYTIIINKRQTLEFTTAGGVNIEITTTIDDVIDYFIDMGGIIGEGISYILLVDPILGDELSGAMIYFLTEGMEIPGAAKAIYDAVQGDSSNLIYKTTTNQIENFLEINTNNTNFADYGRLIPVVGITFNIISIIQNVQVDIHIEIEN